MIDSRTTTRTDYAVHLRDAARDFLADLQVRQRSPRTIAEHRRVLRRLGDWLDHAGLGWNTIRTAQLAGFLRRRNESRPAATFGEISTLRVFYAWAVEAELITASPATGRAFRTPHRGTPHPRALSVGQVRQLLRHLRDHRDDSLRAHRDEALITTACYTGLRAAELAALRWVDLGWDERSLIVVSGKGRKGRSIKLRDDLAGVLQGWMAAQGHEGQGAVFSVEKSGALQPNQIGRAVRRYAGLLDLPLTTHVLRHTFATQSARRSGDVHSVSRALGHSDLRHTQRYLAPALDDSDRAVESLPGLDAW
jgi:site-specific recombinase XerD